MVGVNCHHKHCQTDVIVRICIVQKTFPLYILYYSLNSQWLRAQLCTLGCSLEHQAACLHHCAQTFTCTSRSPRSSKLVIKPEKNCLNSSRFKQHLLDKSNTAPLAGLLQTVGYLHKRVTDNKVWKFTLYMSLLLSTEPSKLFTATNDLLTRPKRKLTLH